MEETKTSDRERRFGVSAKLSLAGLAFSIPVAIMLGLIVHGIRNDLAFTGKELAGVRYLNAASAVEDGARAFARARESGLKLRPDSMETALDSLAAVQKEFGSLLDITSASLAKRGLAEASPEALSAAWKRLAPASDAAALREMADNARALVGRVGDSSNLILDPDLDSYYLMDLVLLAMPDYLARVDTAASGGAPEEAELFARNIDLPRIATDGAKSLAEDENFYGPSKSLAVNLKPGLASFAAAGKEWLGALRGAGELSIPAERATAAGTSLRGIASKELETLLVIRYAAYRRSLFNAILSAVLSLALATLIIYLVAHGFLAQAQALDTSILAAAGKNLRVEVKRYSRDELGAAAERLGGLLRFFRATIGQIGQAAERLARDSKLSQASSADLRTTAHELTRGSSEIEGGVASLDRSLAEIDSATTSQNAALADVGSEVSSITADSRAVAERAAALSTIAKENRGEVGRGREAVDRVAEASQTLVNELADIKKRVAELEGEAKRAVMVLAAVRDIAEKTSLLAMNAAIEATRAGAVGKGFGVVAGEIRGLSQEAARSIGEIDGAFSAIAAAVKATSSASDRGALSAARLGEESEESRRALGEIKESADRVEAVAAELSSFATALGERTARADSGLALARKRAEEMGSSLAAQTESSGRIARSMQGLGETVEAIARVAARTAEAASELATESAALDSLAAEFQV